jgi:hypothetical protein
LLFAPPARRRAEVTGLRRRRGWRRGKGIGATFYAANCNDDSPLFVATWYPLAILGVSATAFLAGKLLLRW